VRGQFIAVPAYESATGSTVSDAATAVTTTNIPPAAIVWRNGTLTRNNAQNPIATARPETTIVCPACSTARAADSRALRPCASAVRKLLTMKSA
jgi:hypothetical protein